MTEKRKDIVHVSFEIGLLFKGINGLLEVLGGLFMMFLSPARLNYLTILLTQRELSEDPRDLIANTLLNLSHSFSISTQQFGVIYLLSHGIIKSVLIILLYLKKLWAYPLAIFSLFLFILYQIYRYFISYSPFLIFLTVFDIIMIALTYLEYKRVKKIYS